MVPQTKISKTLRLRPRLRATARPRPRPRARLPPRLPRQPSLRPSLRGRARPRPKARARLPPRLRPRPRPRRQLQTHAPSAAVTNAETERFVSVWCQPTTNRRRETNGEATESNIWSQRNSHRCTGASEASFGSPESPYLDHCCWQDVRRAQTRRSRPRTSGVKRIPHRKHHLNSTTSASARTRTLGPAGVKLL